MTDIMWSGDDKIVTDNLATARTKLQEFMRLRDVAESQGVYGPNNRFQQLVEQQQKAIAELEGRIRTLQDQAEQKKKLAGSIGDQNRAKQLRAEAAEMESQAKKLLGGVSLDPAMDQAKQADQALADRFAPKDQPATVPTASTTSPTTTVDLSPDIPAIPVTAAPDGGGGTTTTTAEPDRNPEGLIGVPGGGQVWKVGDRWYMAYFVPGTNPPVPMVWHIRTPDDLAAIFGPDKTPVPNRELSEEEFKATGAINFGFTDELANKADHPFDVFVHDFEKEATIRPWIRDPEILALTVGAILEGRQVTEAELKTTDWWRSHNDAERAWVSLSASNPKEAERSIVDRRKQVRAMLLKAGVSDPPDEVINFIADRWTWGTWSEASALSQIAEIADPFAPGRMHAGLASVVRKYDLTTVVSDTRKVKETVRRWLGPAFAAAWSDEQLQWWAGQLRNDPNAEQKLTETLQRQRLALFKEHTDPTLTYEDIAAPWRGVVTNLWGQQPNESDPLFVDIIRMNDLDEATQLLRSEGIKRGVGKVVTEALEATNQAFNGQVRRVQ